MAGDGNYGGKRKRVLAQSLWRSNIGRQGSLSGFPASAERRVTFQLRLRYSTLSGKPVGRPSSRFWTTSSQRRRRHARDWASGPRAQTKTVSAQGSGDSEELAAASEHRLGSSRGTGSRDSLRREVVTYGWRWELRRKTAAYTGRSVSRMDKS